MILRCANCGIADEDVREIAPLTISHPLTNWGQPKCLEAALALLERSRPYLVKAMIEPTSYPDCIWPTAIALANENTKQGLHTDPEDAAWDITHALLEQYPEAK